MPMLNSQIIYGWGGDPEKVVVGEGDDAKEVVTVEDFITSIRSAETAMGQKILQDNAETHRLNSAIADSGFQTLQPTALLADVIVEINKINAFLSTNLVKLGKE